MANLSSQYLCDGNSGNGSGNQHILDGIISASWGREGSDMA